MRQGNNVHSSTFCTGRMMTNLSAILYSSISFFLSFFSSTQYRLGVTKSDLTRHSGQALITEGQKPV